MIFVRVARREKKRVIRLKLFMNIFFLIVIGYYCYKFVQLLIKMKQEVVLPTTNEEIMYIRKYPQKTVNFPTYSKQKVGIIVYSLMLLYLIVMFIIGAANKNINWPFYLLLFLPLTHSYNLLNLFAVVDDGLLCGSRFVAWKKIKSFHFVPIDANHKFYGYTKEVNDGYELKIRAKHFSLSCIVTSNKMKEKLTEILSEHVMMNEEDSPL